RALFVLTTICAAIFAWRQSALHWSAQRREALGWLLHSARVHSAPVRSAPGPGGTSAYPKGTLVWGTPGELPRTLRIWVGDLEAVRFFFSAPGMWREEDLHWIDDIQRLSQEAQVVRKDWQQFWE